jgi:hypothetical protein
MLGFIRKSFQSEYRKNNVYKAYMYKRYVILLLYVFSVFSFFIWGIAHIMDTEAFPVLKFISAFLAFVLAIVKECNVLITLKFRRVKVKKYV